MSRQVLNRGQFQGDRGPSVDSAWTGTPKINENFEELYTGVPHARLDISTATLTASFRDDGAGNLGWYAGAAGAVDGAQVKVATIDKASGSVTFPVKVNLGGTSGVLGNFADFRLLTANGRGWRLGSTATGTTPGYVYLQATTDGFVSNFTNGLAIDPSGNVGVGTVAPQDRLHVVGSQRFDIGVARAIFQSAATPHVPGNAGSLTLGIADGAGISGVSIVNTHDGTYSSQEIQLSTAQGGVSGTTVRLRVAPGGNILFGSDGIQNLGGPSNRGGTAYFATGTINTSDAREKVTPDGEEITEARDWGVTPPTEAELRVSRRLAAALGWFKFKDAVAAKGFAGARKHFGLTVQFALDVCADEGVDPWSIGIFCLDEITRKVKVLRTFTEQKTEPDPETDLVVEIIDGVPTQVERTRPDRLVFEMVPVIRLDGEPAMLDGKPLLHPVPVMIEVERKVEIDEPAGERLGFRPDQLALFLLAGLASQIEA